MVLINDGAAKPGASAVILTTDAGDPVLGDFNGDGNLDLAAANSGGSAVSFYRGDRSGTFVVAGSYLTGKAPLSLAVSDLDNDGTADLICGDGGSQDLAILLSQPLTAGGRGCGDQEIRSDRSVAELLSPLLT